MTDRTARTTGRTPCPPMRNGPPLSDLAGQRFGRWLAIERAPNNAGRRTAWHCVCACGTEKVVASCHLKSGASTNCGCDKAKGARINTYNGGSKSHPLYRTWCGIIQRCCNVSNPEFKYYGGRGIRICERWRRDFWAFVSDMGPKPTAAHSIDRHPDNNGNYEPGNCRWATHSEQMLNTRSNRLVTYKGKQMPLMAAARLAGVNYQTAKWRLCKGASDEDALK
jgi:hypothetical protein